MKKTEYAGRMSETEGRQLIESSKHDETVLPEFSREVPVSSKKAEKDGNVLIDYKWKKTAGPSVYVRRICYRDGEELDNLYRIAARDGTDSFSFVHNSTVYIIRKTWREVALALYNAYGRIKGVIENIVGYLKTELGNFYIISRIEGRNWSFDRRISRNGISYLDVDSLDNENRSKLVELITEKIAALHCNNLIIGSFSLNNLLISEDDLKFTDLRKLRVSRKKSFVIDEFKNIMQYLLATGIAKKEDICCSVVYYAAENEDRCREWCRENKSSEGELSDVAEEIESDIFS